MKKFEKQGLLSGVIKCNWKVVSGNMAHIQDANWLIAVLSLTAMLTGAACQFCTGSFSLQEPFPRRRAVQQRFVTASLEQLLLYVLNLVIMATLLPQEELKLVPILAAMFIFGRWGLKVCRFRTNKTHTDTLSATKQFIKHLIWRMNRTVLLSADTKSWVNN